MKHRSHPRGSAARANGDATNGRPRPSATLQGGDPTGAGAPASARRRWWFRGLALVLIPILLLGLAEAGLRLAGYGYPTSFFRKLRVQGRDVLVENDKFGLRFFPAEMARNPAPVIMNARKKPGTYRIFLLGESAALGDPRPAYGMGRHLEVLLRERYPEAEFEVVCLAMAAINSHAILPIARECADLEGDLWVVYMGNNEIVGPFGPATVFGRQVPRLGLIRLTLALKTTRLGQWMDRLGQSWRANPAVPWGGLGMFAGQQVSADDPRRELAQRQFARNLEDLLDVARRASCPVVLSTVASNLRDCAPFASVRSSASSPAAQEAFDALLRDAATHEAAGRLEEARAGYERAREMDASVAELQFRLGQCWRAQTNEVAARSAFVLARDLDALPLRADSRINEAIREIARRQGGRVRLVASDDQLASQAPDGIPGTESFFEHVHLSFDGNYRVARALAEAVASELPPALTQGQKAEWASQATCEQRLALTDWNRVGVLRDVLRLIQGAPFNRQANHDAQLRHWHAELERLRAQLTPAAAEAARVLYREALLRSPRDHRLYEGYAEFLEATGNLEEACAQWDAIAAMLPHHFAAYVHAGRLLGRQKQGSLAEQRLRQAIALEPRSGEAHLELGRVLADRGELAAAQAEYREAQRWQPANALICFHLAELLARQEKRDAATEALAKAVQLQPSFWEARYLLGVELAMADRIPEAQHHFEQVLRWRPDHVLAHLNLGIALARQGNRAEARRQMEETLRLDPQNAKARQVLEALSAEPAPRH